MTITIQSLYEASHTTNFTENPVDFQKMLNWNLQDTSRRKSARTEAPKTPLVAKD